MVKDDTQWLLLETGWPNLFKSVERPGIPSSSYKYIWDILEQFSRLCIRNQCIALLLGFCVVFVSKRLIWGHFSELEKVSSHGGRRSGSGRKKIFNSKATKLLTWRKTHKRVWLEGTIYSSWVSARIKCGYSSDSMFAAHLLSLERRRR